eukprot:CAMPEP_0115860354 /NCGR_PEP_ID=MMETSP0287-20121206/17081_1 /TAXON_ID=412157 /ORGANISM="Chrysochromulina rotalis, Strain UIO044" /LENGTH=128 /DNA_ID=CAMNT_0003314669 /DNA_START=439 /DNA_END=822 /DNA_ORIENTATION=-
MEAAHLEARVAWQVVAAEVALRAAVPRAAAVAHAVASAATRAASVVRVVHAEAEAVLAGAAAQAGRMGEKVVVGWLETAAAAVEDTAAIVALVAVMEAKAARAVLGAVLVDWAAVVANGARYSRHRAW